MSLQSYYHPKLTLPPVESIGGVLTSGGNSITIDAAGEQAHLCGQVWLEGGSGSKTISSAGGKIYWRSGSITFANAGTELRVGIQDLSTASSPTQGDGTDDVYATLIGGTDTIGANSSITTAMETGTKTLSHGDKIAIVWRLVTRGGADSVSMSGHGDPESGDCQLPAQTSNTTGSFARSAFTLLAAIEFDDGTVGWIYQAPYQSVTSTSTGNFNSGSATADEYGNFVQLPYQVQADGLWVTLLPTGNAADCEICLYQDPLGSSPTLIEAITYDATQASTTASARVLYLMFSTPRTLAANTAYAVTIRPTTANNVSSTYVDVATAALARTSSLGENCYAIRRLDNAGAFSDWNGGTAKTRRLAAGLVVSKFEDGAAAGGGLLTHPGMSGGMRG